MFSTTFAPLSGELTDLFSYLEAAYRQATKTDPNLQLPADAFIKWSKDYLTVNRPSELFPVDNNLGFMLTNGQRIKLCPGKESGQRGSMANPDTSVPITRMN